MHRGLVVISQQPPPGATRANNSNVNVVLGLPAPKHHHH
jgi:hypothetical protein